MYKPSRKQVEFFETKGKLVLWDGTIRRTNMTEKPEDNEHPESEELEDDGIVTEDDDAPDVDARDEDEEEDSPDDKK